MLETTLRIIDEDRFDDWQENKARLREYHRRRELHEGCSTPCLALTLFRWLDPSSETGSDTCFFPA